MDVLLSNFHDHIVGAHEYQLENMYTDIDINATHRTGSISGNSNGLPHSQIRSARRVKCVRGYQTQRFVESSQNTCVC